MMAAAEVQALLRFLTQDAKIPLSEAMPKITVLRKNNLNTPDAITQGDASILKNIFVDEKVLKQVNNAAKRVSNPKKRATPQSSSSSVKRSRNNDALSLQELDVSLIMPATEMSTEELDGLSVETNRAPLVLAFALVILEFTMPDQPLSSRLSLAQAVVSANSQTKAKSIGLTTGATAEDEGWAQGQPKLKVMNREIPVMRRQIQSTKSDEDSQNTISGAAAPSHEAFWGLDIEALRKSNGPLAAGKLAGSQGPPIYTPQSARSYLLKSFSLDEPTTANSESASSSKKKKTAAEIAATKEKALAVTLKTIRLLCESWASTLSAEDLDKRAWSWYVTVRPDVAQGQSGWGQRGSVKMADILRLRRSE